MSPKSYKVDAEHLTTGWRQSKVVCHWRRRNRGERLPGGHPARPFVFCGLGGTDEQNRPWAEKEVERVRCVSI